MNITPKVLSKRKYTLRDPETGFEKRIQVTKVRTPTGMEDSLYVDVDKDSVQVLGITDQNEVILVRQWRPNSEDLQVELPGGGLEPGEDPAEGARRELREETGYEAGEIRFLMSPRYSPYSTGRRFSFVATGCRKVGKLDLDPNESLHPFLVDLTVLSQEIAQKPGTIRGEDIILHHVLRLLSSTTPPD